MSSRIIVKSLPKDVTQDKLIDHVKKILPSVQITDCNLKFTREGVFRQFAFIGFNSEEDANNAQSQLNGTFIRTTKIQADVANDIGDFKGKVWSKHAQKNKVAAAAKSVQQSTKATASTSAVKSEFNVRMKGLTGFYTEKTVKTFFKPLKPKSVKIPRNSQKKPMGLAYVEFLSKKDLDDALRMNKNTINETKVFLKHMTVATEEKKGINPPAWELKAKTRQASEQEIETIEESGRLFVRNLWFGVTDEMLEEMFGKYGPIAEVTIPVDPLTKKAKGFAHIVFVFPEHALKAYTELDYKSLHGRLLHVLPGREANVEDESTEKSSFKKKKEQERKANSSNSQNWNSLFLGANAVADAMAERYQTEKSQILDDELRGSVGVRMALGETQIVSETRQFLIENGISLDCFSQAAGQRSKTVILVKNLTSGVTTDELKEVFGKHGTVLRVVMPPAGITAIIEYMEPSEAKKGFTKLNFSKFRSIPLYLEWAPMGVFTKPAPVIVKEQPEEDEDVKKVEIKEEPTLASEPKEMIIKEEKIKEEAKESDDLEPEEDTTLFVKNLNFNTTDELLTQHFEPIGSLYSATVSKKKDMKNPGVLLSMGYGFVQFMKKKDAKEALKQLQNNSLDGHNLELKMSTRTTSQQQAGRKKQAETKQKSTKILVRNIPFEAKKREIEELFKVFGELKFVRLPKKLQGTGPHRGFAFVDFLTKQDAKRAFNALCHSTHLYGRRLVLEWAEEEESVEELRRKTAQHFGDDGPKKKKHKKSDILNELE